MARGVAVRLNFRYVDTGAMYRSVALVAVRHGVDLTDHSAVAAVAESLAVEFYGGPDGQRVIVDGRDVTASIRAPEISDGASIVSVVPRVRAALVAMQRALGAAGGVVMEGRDIGTVVFPDADVKVFLEATLESRARRRYDELRARGIRIDLDEVRRAQAERDRRDATREHSPMRPAPDATVIDTTDRSVEEVVDTVVDLVRERTGVV